MENVVQEKLMGVDQNQQIQEKFNPSLYTKEEEEGGFLASNLTLFYRTCNGQTLLQKVNGVSCLKVKTQLAFLCLLAVPFCTVLRCYGQDSTLQRCVSVLALPVNGQMSYVFWRRGEGYK